MKRAALFALAFILCVLAFGLFVIVPLDPSQTRTTGQSSWADGATIDEAYYAYDITWTIMQATYSIAALHFTALHSPVKIVGVANSSLIVDFFVLTYSSYENWQCHLAFCNYSPPSPYVFSSRLWLTVAFSFDAGQSDLSYYFVFVNKNTRVATVNVALTYDWVVITPHNPNSTKIVVSIPFLIGGVIAGLFGLRTLPKKTRTEAELNLQSVENQADVTKGQLEPTEPTKFCRECGAKIPRSSKFCKECGNSVS